MLLNEARVAITPGEAFDAPGFIRISYATSLDVEEDAGLLTRHDVVVSNFHDEYWSSTMRTRFEDARLAGTSLA